MKILKSLLTGYCIALTVLSSLAQGIVGTTSANGVNIIFQDGFNASSLDLTAPFDLTKWSKSNESGTPASPSIQTALWGTHNGYESTSTHWLSQTLGISNGAYIWSPQIALPAGSNLFARVNIRTGSFTGGGTFTVGMAFDGNNDLVVDVPANTISETFTGSGPYNDYAGFFFTAPADRSRLLNFDLSAFGGQTGRLGILLKETSMTMGETFQIDWFVIGTRPINDLCGGALQLVNGLNGGVNGFYNTTASGLIPSLNSGSTGPPDSRTFIGGSSIYIGGGTNGIGSIPNASGVIDGFQPSTTSNPGTFSGSAQTVENSTWYKFTTPVNPALCAAGPLTVRLTVENLSCARNSTNISNNLQLRVFNSTVCGSTADASTLAINAAVSLANNNSVTTPALAYNTTYYVVVDGIQGNDCRFKIRVETLLNGVVQTINDCVVLPVELLDFSAEPLDENNVQIHWVTATEHNNDYFTVERSGDGEHYETIQKVSGAGNSTEQVNYSFVDVRPITGMNYYRLTQTDYDGRKTVYDADAVWMGTGSLMKVVPNPGTGEFHLFSEDGFRGDISIQVIDLAGRTHLFEEKRLMTKESSMFLDLSNLEEGIYQVKVISSGVIHLEKLIISR